MLYIRPRKLWKARPAKATVIDQAPSSIHTIVVHHTAGTAPRTRQAAAAEMRFIQQLHFQNGWSDIGYNIVIDPLGGIWEGRGILSRGAHTLNHNTGTIGISFMGNYETRRLNAKQKLAYRTALRKLRKRGVSTKHIQGHCQMPDQATACPGKHILEQLGLK